MPLKKKTKRAKRDLLPAKRPAGPGKRTASSLQVGTKSSPTRLGTDFPIVGVGASAGGLEALEELFAQMPVDTGMAFVVVTHQHPSHTSMLPQLLAKSTKLRVVEAAEGMRLEPNRVYVGPPGGYLAVFHNTLRRMETGKFEAPHLPIDYFFRSLADDKGERAICIVLSGTGTDGTLGLKAVKGASGMTMVQEAASAKYAGMPSSAAATGLADFVLSAADMPRQLVAYARGPHLAGAHLDDSSGVMPEPMQKIFVLLRSRTGHDFSSYKSTTIRRRIERRMNLQQIKAPAEYIRFLQENPHEIDILFKELLISVTSFFRDPEAFESLASSALQDLLKARTDNYTFRIWVPGCASGEEAYSLAILMREVMEATKKHLDVQIFGTDLDNEAIDAARNGKYPDGIAVDVSAQRLERYFVREDGSYRVRKDIREMVIFAVQNVIKDPPFTKLDMISCRNVLIYLNADLQKRLLPVFHYALKPDGLLFLGPSESIGNATDLFDVINKKWKIFRRKETSPAAYPMMELPKLPLKSHLEEDVRAATLPQRESNIGGLVDRLLLGRFAPASVVVNDRGDIAYIHGRTGAFLEPAAGHPRLNVISMAREGLQIDLASALRQAATSGGEVIREGVRVGTAGEFSHANVIVSRITEPEALRGLFLISFKPQPRHEPAPKRRGKTQRMRGPGRVEELERELQSTKESLQTTIEELETSNEELKSTNEEIQSTNEELQSTNEELETSKEEMQSLNEELTTVNAELHSKVEELSRANDDMQNLLNSTEIATVFLDNDLNIKRYTDQARRLINLIQTDIGRPVGDLVSSLTYDHLVPDCRDVLRTLMFKQAEVQTKDGHWYLMRIMPYRTADNVIDGLVLTFVDINPVKEAEKTVLRMSKVFLNAPDPMLILDSAGRIGDVNEEAVRVYGWSRQEMLGQPVHMTVPEEHAGIVNARLKSCLAGEPVRNVECIRVNKAGQALKGDFTLILLADEHGRPDGVCMVGKHLST